jgi:hypothetical protein
VATVKEARRAVERGDVDEALVLLWNALEPLRLAGDTAGLQRVAALADEIAVLGDGEHAHEAARLHAAVVPLIGDDAGAVARSTSTISESVERWIEALGGAPDDAVTQGGAPPVSLPVPPDEADEPEPQRASSGGSGRWSGCCSRWGGCCST